MKPSLVILAAGMGSRYGKLKQMDAFGPCGETIMDYSIFDAIEAGFGTVVFVVRKHFKQEFEDLFRPKLEGKIEQVYATQELDEIPEGCSIPNDRTRPWGTAHAVQMASKYTDGPFAVINADDYYGKTAFQALAGYFTNDKQKINYCLVGYLLGNTLSDHGTVNRGICEVDEDGFLKQIVEVTRIKKNDHNEIVASDPASKGISLNVNTLVSMNMFGFYPSYFKYFEKYFSQFVNENQDDIDAEFYIPTFLDILMGNKEIKVNVLTSDSDWFGVTYQQDKPFVQSKIKGLIEAGQYPERLW